MEDKLITQLKKLKRIEPNPFFAANSRRTILALRKEEPVFAWLNLRVAGVMTGMVAAVAASVFLFSAPSATMVLASPEVLNQEFKDLNINIELSAIGYHQNIDQTVISALSEITDNQIKHLNQDILQTESEELDLNSSTTDPEIESLLDKIIF